MSTTVAEFAKERCESSEDMLKQLRQAGVAKNALSDPLTEAEKLKFSKARMGFSSLDRPKVTLTISKKSAVVNPDASDGARRIRLEVRNKRTFIHKEDETTAEAKETAAPSLTPSVGAAVLEALRLPAPEQQDLRDFVAELEAALGEISNAVDQSQKTTEQISELKEKINNRGWIGAIAANFSGSTQKDLTAQVLTLSKSISVTQQVVHVMLKAQTRSDRVLHAFNEALIRKITDVQTDTKTLDGNQRSAALALLTELQRQVQEYIRQRELVEIHESWLQELREESDETVRILEGVEADLTQLQNSSAAQELRIDSIGQWQMDQNRCNEQSASKIARMDSDAEEMRSRFSQLEEWSHNKDVGDLALHQQLSQSESHVAALKKHIDGLENRLSTLEASQLQARSLGRRIARQVPALIAAGLAATAMFRAVVGA